MLIAVMSDLHDNLAAWELVLGELVKRKINILINCGDTVAPATLSHMSETFPGTIHTVFGNNADRELETKMVETLMNVEHHGDRGGIEIGGKRIGFVHYPEVAEAMTKLGEFDLVCHGHTHLKRFEKIGGCLVLNPGTAGGVFQYPSIAMINVSELKHEFVDLKI